MSERWRGADRVHAIRKDVGLDGGNRERDASENRIAHGVYPELRIPCERADGPGGDGGGERGHGPAPIYLFWGYTYLFGGGGWGIYLIKTWYSYWPYLTPDQPALLAVTCIISYSSTWPHLRS